MGKSAFNMSQCGSRGGTGTGGCTSGGWVKIEPTGGDEITVVSDDKLRSALREIFLENRESHITQVADVVTLKYDCPKVGDAVFWNSYKNGYDLASAEIDNSNYFKDPEHLIESLGIVERVDVSCTEGTDVPEVGYSAKVVFFGKITFPEESNPLDPGTVYYLADSFARVNIPSDKIIGSNAVHANHEPVISKPLFVSTGPHTAIVTNYRPLTGSPTGGRPLSEEYKVVINPHEYRGTDGEFLYTGWKIEVENVGTVTSRNHLLLQVEYNKLEGPQEKTKNNLIGSETYVYHFDIGVLYNSAEASVRNDDNIVSSKIIDFNPDVESEVITGIGEITVKLKVITQSTANIDFNDKLNAPEVLLTNSSELKVSRLVPKLSWTGNCSDNLLNDNDIFVKGDTIISSSDLKYEEGTVFEIKLLSAIVGSVGSDSQFTMKVPMPYKIGFKIEALLDNATDIDEVNKLWTPVTNSFKLELGETETIEVIPVSSDGSTIVEKKLRIHAVSSSGSPLPETHWAYVYSVERLSNNTIRCLSKSCCIDELEQFHPEQVNSFEKSITNILTEGDSDLYNNKDNAKFFSKKSNGIAFQGHKSSLSLSWANCRENTTFCYPPVDEGTHPSFMTIYTNEARVIPDISKHTESSKGQNESQYYDPRYTIMSIGAQDSLDGELVRITVNYGGTNKNASEVCYTLRYNGSIEGTHYTLQELKHLYPDSFTERVIDSDPTT